MSYGQKVLKALPFGLLAGSAVTLMLAARPNSRGGNELSQATVKQQLPFDSAHFHTDPKLFRLFASLEAYRDFNREAYDGAGRSVESLLCVRHRMHRGLLPGVDAQGYKSMVRQCRVYACEWLQLLCDSARQRLVPVSQQPPTADSVGLYDRCTRCASDISARVQELALEHGVA